MKKILVIKRLLIALCLSALVNTGFAQNDADPAITSFSFAASPIMTGTNTTLTVFFINNGFTTPIAAGSVALKLSLPTSGEYRAFPEGTPALSGTFLSKFTWTYNSGTKSFFGTSNQAIAPGDGGTVTVTVRGFVPIVSAISIANIQRLNPAAYPNENVNNNNLTAALGVIVGGPNPIYLLDFNAVKQGTTVQLSWKTTSEINSKRFDVQTSTDGSNWTSIGSVAAAGFSTTQRSYGFVHTNPIMGVNYYRLQLIDLDATFSYSTTKQVTFSEKPGIKIWPNPTTDFVYISTNTASSFKSITIYAADGRLMQQLANIPSGQAIDMRKFAPGAYTLRIIDKKDNTEVRSLIKN